MGATHGNRVGRETRGSVSIHAPVMGATVAGWNHTGARAGFNPRARDGRDAVPCGCAAYGCRFNPRARDGRDTLLTLMALLH